MKVRLPFVALAAFLRRYLVSRKAGRLQAPPGAHRGARLPYVLGGRRVGVATGRWVALPILISRASLQEFNNRQRKRQETGLLTAERKEELIKSFAIREGDTGSSEVQVAILTERIKYLTTHLRANKHDYHTRRGLLMLVGQRRRHLRYLNNKNVNTYRDVIARLGLRK